MPESPPSLHPFSVSHTTCPIHIFSRTHYMAHPPNQAHAPFIHNLSYGHTTTHLHTETCTSFIHSFPYTHNLFPTPSSSPVILAQIGRPMPALCIRKNLPFTPVRYKPHPMQTAGVYWGERLLWVRILGWWIGFLCSLLIQMGPLCLLFELGKEASINFRWNAFSSTVAGQI